PPTWSAGAALVARAGRGVGHAASLRERCGQAWPPLAATVPCDEPSSDRFPPRANRRPPTRRATRATAHLRQHATRDPADSESARRPCGRRSVALPRAREPP